MKGCELRNDMGKSEWWELSNIIYPHKVFTQLYHS